MIVRMTGSEWFTSRAGGLNRYFQDLYDALSRQPVVLSGAAFGEAPAQADSWAPVGGSTSRRVATAAKIEARRRADVHDVHFALYGLGALWAARGRQGGLVVHFQGPWALESLASGASRRSARAKRALERFTYRRADLVVVLSEAFKRIAVDEYGVRPERVQVIPPGVDLERFRPGSMTSPSELTVTCVRRLERRMGVDVLLRAWVLVLAHHPTARLRVLGDGSQRQALEALARELGLTSSVSFLGRVPDDVLVRTYQESTLSVVPTTALEGFGLVALESLACGTPVVVTDCGGLPDAVAGLDPSLVVAPSDPDALARRIIDAAAGRLPAREDCRSHAERFAWDRVAEQHVDSYRAVADQLRSTR